MPAMSTSNVFGSARAVVRNAPISVWRTRTPIPRAARSACTSCSATLSPLPTVSSSTSSPRPPRRRRPSAPRRQPAASRRESAAAVSRTAGGDQASGLSGGSGPAHGVPNPASATSTMRARSIARATARRTRASSNGARVVLKNSAVLNRTG